ncbi:hypothetical protein PR048_028054 [Dryococelus australis]|uniref:Uncharacterized protein n=1 Tax=Dryococelus australis TaxID=614101 RepID=A0ABQ9GI89_9NEOP|nr:hypothetical protein PR048_028054 [Dryococelus australis]
MRIYKSFLSRASRSAQFIVNSLQLLSLRSLNATQVFSIRSINSRISFPPIKDCRDVTRVIYRKHELAKDEMEMKMGGGGGGSGTSSHYEVPGEGRRVRYLKNRSPVSLLQHINYMLRRCICSFLPCPMLVANFPTSHRACSSIDDTICLIHEQRTSGGQACRSARGSARAGCGPASPGTSYSPLPSGDRAQRREEGHCITPGSRHEQQLHLLASGRPSAVMDEGHDHRPLLSVSLSSEPGPGSDDLRPAEMNLITRRNPPGRRVPPPLRLCPNSPGSTYLCVPVPGSDVLSAVRTASVQVNQVVYFSHTCGICAVILRSNLKRSRFGFSHVGLVPDDEAGFLWDLTFHPPLHSGAAPYSLRHTLIGSQGPDVTNRQNISTLLLFKGTMYLRVQGQEAIRATLIRTPSASSLLRARRAVFPLCYASASVIRISNALCRQRTVERDFRESPTSAQHGMQRSFWTRTDDTINTPADGELAFLMIAAWLKCGHRAKSGAARDIGGEDERQRRVRDDGGRKKTMASALSKRMPHYDARKARRKVSFLDVMKLIRRKQILGPTMCVTSWVYRIYTGIFATSTHYKFFPQYHFPKNSTTFAAGNPSLGETTREEMVNRNANCGVPSESDVSLTSAFPTARSDITNLEHSIILRHADHLSSLPSHRQVTTPARGCGGVVVRLLASHKYANRVQSPAGLLPDSHTWESCRTMPLVGGFSRGFPVFPRPYVPSVLTSLHPHWLSRPR